MIHPSSTMLPSTLPPQAPSQAPWLSCSSGFSASFPPETGIKGWDGRFSSGWLHFSNSSPCPYLSRLMVHQAGPLSWGMPFHWLSSRRGDTHKAWNLHVEGFSSGSHLPAVTCPSCSCLLGGVWGVVCNGPDSQPTKSDWVWIRPRKGFVFCFGTQEHKRAESGYLLSN